VPLVEEATMLSEFRRVPAAVLTGFVVAVAALTPRAASASSCAVIDFSAVKQRTKGLVIGETVSTLVATPAAAPGDFVVLEADFGCVVSDGFDPVAANNAVSVEVQRSESGAFADPALPASFESFAVPGGNVQALDCAGSSCNGLRFQMPDSGLAGPARITVTRAGKVVARIFAIGVRTSSCDVDSPDTLLGTFTLLPPYNPLAVSATGVANPGLKAAIAGNGSLLLPLEHPLVGEPAVDATATRATGPEIDKIPNGRFVRALSDLFRPLPAIHRLVPFGSSAQALYSTADVLRSTMQVLASDPLDSNVVYPDNFHAFRSSPAGPVVFPNPITVKFEGASPVVALRSSEETVAIGISEELLGDLNADADASDLLLSATDLPTGGTTDTGQAIAQVAASPARPVVAVVDDIVAFLESEALSANADLNGDAAMDDLVARILKGAVPQNPGAPVDTSADPRRAIDGSQLAISQGFVFFRTPELATAPHTTARVSDVNGQGGDDTSDQPSIDGAGAHVAYSSRAANLAAGASGAHRQVLVTDLFSGLHTLASAGSGGEGNADSFDAALSRDGGEVAFASLASNLGGGAGGSAQVVWERGVNITGSSLFGLSFATFELATGEEDVAGVDYSPCTASDPGISLSFANDGTVTGFLATSSSGACAFHANFSGSYAQVGDAITVDAPLTSFNGVPALPGDLSDLRLFAVLTVTDGGPLGGFEFVGSFDLLANAGVPSAFAQVYARATGGTAPLELVSAAQGGGAGEGASGEPALSGDGRLVAFASAAADLVDSDGNGVSDVFLRDRLSDTTERVSITNAEAEANGASSAPALTPDGNLVAFASSASNLVGAGADTNGAGDVFLRDRAAGSTERISVPAPGGSAAGASGAPDLSDDGRFVVFESAAALVPEDTNGVSDVYLRDRAEQSTERMSVASGGEQADDGSFGASLSGDGNFVVFASLAGNLVPGSPAGANVYRRNRLTGTVELLSLGAAEGDTSTSPDANTNGLTVAFASDASLVLNDSLPVDVFVRATGAGADLNEDGDDLDTVLQSFATASVPGLQPAARVAASVATTGSGRVLVSVPEAEEGNANRNAASLILGAAADGDSDTSDAVLHLYDGSTQPAPALVNLGVAGSRGALSSTTLCALADEAQQNGADLDGQGGASSLVLVAGDIATLLASPSSKSLVNAGIAATQVHVAGTVCVFTAAAGGILQFYDLATAKLVSSGLPATAVQVGPTAELVAFRVPENGQDLNGDDDGTDEVMHAVAMSAVLGAADGAVITSEVTNLGLQGIDCDLPGCEAFRFGSILADGSISFLGTEPGESVDDFDCLATSQSVCDFNGDGDGADTVVHFVKTVAVGSTVEVTSVGSLALTSVGEQQTPPFPLPGPEGTSTVIQATECEAARYLCPETRSKLNDPIGPPLSSCEERFDVDLDGVLDCSTLRNFVGLDSDGDGIIDPFDNAVFASNPEQTDSDGDGVGDGVGAGFDTVASVAPCDLDCDLNEDGSIDQDDVDAILAAVAAGGQAQGGVQSAECGDRRDRDADRRITFLDASLCKAAFCEGCSPPLSPPPPPPAPAPSGGGGGCGIGIELVALLPVLMAAHRRRRRSH
jgi:Tol biopolymer transport system component